MSDLYCDNCGCAVGEGGLEAADAFYEKLAATLRERIAK